MKLIYFIILLISPISISALELTIINEQNDSNKNQYTYNINISNISGSYKYTLNNKTSYLTFDAIGNTTVTLNPNEIITIYDLPDSEYKITQNINNNYITYINNNKTYSITSNISKINKVTFTNKNKKVTSPTTSTIPLNTITIISIILITLLIITKIKIKRYI
jgi:hypothetical protein